MLPLQNEFLREIYACDMSSLPPPFLRIWTMLKKHIFGGVTNLKETKK